MKPESYMDSHGIHRQRMSHEEKNELQETVETVDRQGYETHGSPEERRHQLVFPRQARQGRERYDRRLRICDSLDVELNEIAETVPCEEASAEVRSDAGRSRTRLRQ